MLNYDAFPASAAQTDPFPYSVTPGLLSPQGVAEANRDYPKIDMGGLFLPEMASAVRDSTACSRDSKDRKCGKSSAKSSTST